MLRRFAFLLLFCLSACRTITYRKALLDDAMQHAPVVDGKPRLLIFVHGGLNFQVSSVVSATDLVHFMQAHNAPTYPICVNWQSSFFSTYWDHVAHIRQGEYWTGGGSVTLAPLWIFGDVVRAVDHAPVDIFYEIKSIYDGVKRHEFYDRIDAQSDPNGKPAMRAGKDTRTRTRKAIGFATETVTLPFKFVTAPLVDGFGTGAWDAMEHRTTTLFQNDAESDVAQSLIRQSDGGLSIFLRELEQRIKADGRPWSITLVGHSMGAIIVNNIVAHPNTTMNHVMLERHAEAREWNIHDVVPRGTLLVWIDNLLSKPESLLERRVGRYTNFMRDIHSTPPSITDRVTVLTFDGGPKLAKTQPQAHGAAGGVQFWRDECVKPAPDYPTNCMILRQ